MGLLSTYPPTQCGLATFTKALAEDLGKLPGCTYFVVRALEQPTDQTLPDVDGHLVAGDRVSQRRAASLLNRADVAIVQHEYGIYGGPDGVELLAVLRQLRVPLIVVLHTVLSDPSDSQRRVLESVCDLAAAVVTMSRAARSRLIANYRVSERKVVVIPHGAVALAAESVAPIAHRILTWGLLGPGKGIEWGVQALAQLRDLDVQPEYLVAGQIHPKVAEREGEAYRDSLRALATRLGVDDLLRFDPSYRPTSALPELIGSAGVVLLPYDSSDQVTSGVLIEAVAAGRPVVATAFPHALELLESGAGLTVPHRDPHAIALALRRVLSDPAASAAMAAAARVEAAKLDWSVVARQYHQLAGQLLAAAPRPVGVQVALGQ